MDPRLAKWRWRCRRGMKELDFLLGRFVELEGPNLNDTEAAIFEQILGLEDDLLWSAVMGRNRTGNNAMDGMIEQIRSSDN